MQEEQWESDRIAREIEFKLKHAGHLPPGHVMMQAELFVGERENPLTSPWRYELVKRLVCPVCQPKKEG